MNKQTTKNPLPSFEDDFVQDSERPYSDASGRNVPTSRWSLDQYLSLQFIIPTVALSVGLLYFLYWLGVFQVISLVVEAALLLLIAVIIVAYLDNSLTAENADLITRIDLSDWRTVRAALNRQHKHRNKNDDTKNFNVTDESEEDDDDEIFGRGGSPYYGQQLEENMEEVRLQVLSDALQTMKMDMVNHIDNQRRNSNIHIVVAIITSLTGIFVLVGTSLNSPDHVQFSLSQAVMAVMIGVFAAFFMLQYNAAQNRVKYFQNELTNLNARIAAFQLSYVLEEKDAIRDIIADLTRTERNFKIGKNDQLP